MAFVPMTDAEKAAYNKGKANAKKGYSNKTGKYKKGAYKKKNTYYKDTYKKNKKAPGMLSAGGAAAGGALGTYLGGPAGTAIGSFLGGKIGHLVETITGFGDYNINSNTIMKGGMSPPQVVNSVNKGGFIIRHREYIGDIQATMAFSIRKYPINPGQSITFPWLSQIAANFDQYRFRGVLYEYKSTSSDAVLSSATSSALGSVSMATDYDALDQPYTNKREMLNSLFANSNKPSCSFIHPIECKRSNTPMQLQYTRTGAFPPNSDARMYDLGNFYLATEGMQADGGILGELWVTYEVEFYKQQVSASAMTDHFKINGAINSSWLAVQGPPTAHPADPSNVIGGRINDAGTSYIFPPTVGSGKFLFTYWVSGSAATVAEVIITAGNASLVDIWNSGTLFIQAPPTGTSTTQLQVQFVVELSGINATVSFGTATIPTGSTVGDLMVTKIESNISDF